MNNRLLPHVHILPEDDATREIANGFSHHPAVNRRNIHVLQPPGGWPKVLQSLENTHVSGLRKYPQRILILIIDFDGRENRLQKFQNAIPVDLKERIFVLGARIEPEDVKRSIPGLSSYEMIGNALAEDCDAGTMTTWGHPELICNIRELERMRTTVTPCLFAGSRWR